MAQKKNRENTNGDWQTAAEDSQRRLNMLDDRLDNIDSIVSALVERVMHQAAVIKVNCPHCGQNVEVAVIGNLKSSGNSHKS